MTIVASSFSTKISLDAQAILAQQGIHAEVIDLRVVNPLDISTIVSSVENTGRLLVVDGGWSPCGLASEVISSVVERLSSTKLKALPARITLPFSPAPTSRVLERTYYPTSSTIVSESCRIMSQAL